MVDKGKKAKKVAIRTLKNQNVTLQPTGSGGRFEFGGKGRPLAYIKMSNGSDYGLDMIRKGLCYDYSHRYPHRKAKQYKAAQRKAGVFRMR